MFGPAQNGQKPILTVSARERGSTPNFARWQGDRLIPGAWNAFDHLDCGVFKKAFRMAPVDEQWRSEHGRSCDLMRRGGIAAPRAEDDRRVIAGPSQVAREWQSRVVTGARADVAAFQSADPFP